MTETLLHIEIEPHEAEQRLDRVLRRRYPAWGRKAVGRLISSGGVRVNENPIWLCSWQVAAGDRVTILDPPPAKAPSITQFDERWIIAETDDLIAVDKPAGLLSEATRWRTGDNLRDLAARRFGPVHLFHRLDRDTSGVMLLTRGGEVNQRLDKAFKENAVVKEYVALVAAANDLPAQDEVRSRLAQHPRRRDMMAVVEHGGKWAHTRYQVVARDEVQTCLRLWPITGRTHQLRVHLAHLGAPILGDRLYGARSDSSERLLLHAWCITIPAAGDLPSRRFVAPLPPEWAPWRAALEELEE